MKLEYVCVDDRNAVLFNYENTEYIKEEIKQVTLNPKDKEKIYYEIAKHFAVDSDKVNNILVLYVNKMKNVGKMKGRPEFEKDVSKLCRKIGHRYFTIKLSGLRGYNRCERCGRVVTKYRIRA
jgi:hypothetical protein